MVPATVPDRAAWPAVAAGARAGDSALRAAVTVDSAALRVGRIGVDRGSRQDHRAPRDRSVAAAGGPARVPTCGAAARAHSELRIAVGDRAAGSVGDLMACVAVRDAGNRPADRGDPSSAVQHCPGPRTMVAGAGSAHAVPASRDDRPVVRSGPGRPGGAASAFARTNHAGRNPMRVWTGCRAIRDPGGPRPDRRSEVGRGARPTSLVGPGPVCVRRASTGLGRPGIVPRPHSSAARGRRSSAARGRRSIAARVPSRSIAARGPRRSIAARGPRRSIAARGRHRTVARVRRSTARRPRPTRARRARRSMAATTSSAAPPGRRSVIVPGSIGAVDRRSAGRHSIGPPGRPSARQRLACRQTN